VPYSAGPFIYRAQGEVAIDYMINQRPSLH
jgi:hypothetical protein